MEIYWGIPSALPESFKYTEGVNHQAPTLRHEPRMSLRETDYYDLELNEMSSVDRWADRLNLVWRAQRMPVNYQLPFAVYRKNADLEDVQFSLKYVPNASLTFQPEVLDAATRLTRENPQDYTVVYLDSANQLPKYKFLRQIPVPESDHYDASLESVAYIASLKDDHTVMTESGIFPEIVAFRVRPLGIWIDWGINGVYVPEPYDNALQFRDQFFARQES